MTYKPGAASPANDRSSPEFIKHLEQLARRLYFSAQGISERNRDFLQEFAGGRYELVALQRLIVCARASNNPTDREALAEIIRAELLKDVPPASNVAAVFDDETEAQGATDLAQREFERAPCVSTRSKVFNKLIRQLNATRRALDVVGNYML